LVNNGTEEPTITFFFLCGVTAQIRLRRPHCWGFSITHRHSYSR